MQCRANPPQVVVVIESATISGMNVSKVESKWPAVDANDWCGQYEDGRRDGVRKTAAQIVNEDLSPILLGRRQDGKLEGVDE